MAEVIATGEIHPDDVKLSLALAPHNKKGDVLSYTGGTAGSGAACPTGGIVVQQKMVHTITASKTLAPADCACLLNVTVSSADVVLTTPTAAALVAYFGLHVGDIMEIEAINTYAPGSSTPRKVSWAFGTGITTTVGGTTTAADQKVAGSSLCKLRVVTNDGEGTATMQAWVYETALVDV